MFDATKLLGSMMQSRSAPSATGRLDRAVQNSDSGSPLGQLLSQFGGGGGQSSGFGSILGGLFGGGQGMGGSTATGGGAGGMLGGIGDLVQRAANSPGQEVSRNNPAAIGGLGALAGALLGGGRGAIGGGLMSVLGSLAYSAMQRQGQAAEPGMAQAARAVPPEEAYASPDDVQRKALLMLRAMIQAAKADGQIDGQEMDRITGKLDEAGEDHAARDFVLKELRGPVDVAALARDVQSTQEGAEIYAASLMAIEIDSQAERDYLGRLAQALGLAAPAVAHIHETLGVKA